jgi:hypothetical protein
MNGSYMGKVIDGVLYRIIECDNVELFADKDLYLAVSDTAFFSRNAYDYDEETGLITANAAYVGTNILFDLKLDSSKADPVKAEAYIKQLEDEWNQDIKDQDNVQAENKNMDEASEVKPKTQQDIFTDDNNKITFSIKEKDSFEWWVNSESVQTILSYYLDVDGSDIKTLNCSLNQGEFCSNPTDDLRELGSYGNKCSITREELTDRDNLYSILVNADLKDVEKESGAKDRDVWGKQEYDAVIKAIESTKLDLEIIMKDGRTINKTLTFDNVSDDNLNITVSVE